MNTIINFVGILIVLWIVQYLFMKNKKNTLFFISIKIFIVIVFACLCYLNFFQALDFQLYDSLIKLRKQPEQNQKILMVKIDEKGWSLAVACTIPT